MGEVTELKENRQDLNREDLPEELLSQLKKSRSYSLAYQNRVIKIIADLGVEANVDNILIVYYREHQEILKRNGLITRLNTWLDKGLIEKTDVKGFYTTP